MKVKLKEEHVYYLLDLLEINTDRLNYSNLSMKQRDKSIVFDIKIHRKLSNAIQKRNKKDEC